MSPSGPDTTQLRPPVTPPIIVAAGEDCTFHRDVADAVRSGVAADAAVFDSAGTRLVVAGAGLSIAANPDGTDELAELLRAWLGRMDALRESTANWPLSLLVRASVDHLGYR